MSATRKIGYFGHHRRRRRRRRDGDRLWPGPSRESAFVFWTKAMMPSAPARGNFGLVWVQGKGLALYRLRPLDHGGHAAVAGVLARTDGSHRNGHRTCTDRRSVHGARRQCPREAGCQPGIDTPGHSAAGRRTIRSRCSITQLFDRWSPYVGPEVVGRDLLPARWSRQPAASVACSLQRIFSARRRGRQPGDGGKDRSQNRRVPRHGRWTRACRRASGAGCGAGKSPTRPAGWPACPRQSQPGGKSWSANASSRFCVILP